MARLTRMRSRYAGKCKKCGERYSVGDPIYWSRATGAYCTKCGDPGSGEIRSQSPPTLPTESTDANQVKVTATNPELQVTQKRRDGNYWMIDWSDLKSILTNAIVNRQVSNVKSNVNESKILEHTGEVSKWHGYTQNDLKRWITKGYEAQSIRGLGDFTPPLREKRRLRYLEDGDEILVDRALSGDDNYMVEWTKRESIPGVAIEAEIMFSSGVSAEIVNQWNTFICRSVHALELIGIDAQVTLKFTSRNLVGDSETYHTIVRVKQENEQSDFLSFSAMLSPAALRTCGFTAMCLHADQSGKRVTQGLGHGHSGSEWAIKWDSERRVLNFNCPYNPYSFPEEKLTGELRQALHSMKSG